jgi:uncharacterized protein
MGVVDLLLASPPVLFFFLGMIAALVKSNLFVPKAVTRLLSLYLLWAIGFQGGVKLSKAAAAGLWSDMFWSLGAAMILASIVPVYSFFILRRKLDPANAAAIAAAYGSVSAVTFGAAKTVLENGGEPFGGHMVAAMALMESPAIVIAVLLLRSSRQTQDPNLISPAAQAKFSWPSMLHEAFLNGPVLLLLGSMVIGILTGERGYQAFKPLATDLWSGVLVFFLLDLGILAAKRLKDLRKAGWMLIVFGLVMPLINAALALLLAKLAGLSVGDGTLLMVLGASASYIAVPAAVRIMIPQANPGLYIPLPLAVTFPFNITFGIPLYWSAAKLVLHH